MDIDSLNPGMPLPFYMPPEQGVRLEFFMNRFTVFLRYNNHKSGEAQAFEQGFDSYSYYEHRGSCPVVLWIFRFKKPVGHVEVNFDASLIKEDDFIQLSTKNSMKDVSSWKFLFVDNNILIKNMSYHMNCLAIEKFLLTLRKQRSLNYNSDLYDNTLRKIYQKAPEDIYKLGKIFINSTAHT